MLDAEAYVSSGDELGEVAAPKQSHSEFLIAIYGQGLGEIEVVFR